MNELQLTLLLDNILGTSVSGDLTFAEAEVQPLCLASLLLALHCSTDGALIHLTSSAFSSHGKIGIQRGRKWAESALASELYLSIYWPTAGA